MAEKLKRVCLKKEKQKLSYRERASVLGWGYLFVDARLQVGWGLGLVLVVEQALGVLEGVVVVAVEVEELMVAREVEEDVAVVVVVLVARYWRRWRMWSW